VVSDIDFQNGETYLIKKVSTAENVDRLEPSSLKDVPIEDRKKEAKKPLFLIRYE
jgi:hypothetical protein